MAQMAALMTEAFADEHEDQHKDRDDQMPLSNSTFAGVGQLVLA